MLLHFRLFLFFSRKNIIKGFLVFRGTLASNGLMSLKMKSMVLLTFFNLNALVFRHLCTHQWRTEIREAGIWLFTRNF